MITALHCDLHRSANLATDKQHNFIQIQPRDLCPID